MTYKKSADIKDLGSADAYIKKLIRMGLNSTDILKKLKFLNAENHINSDILRDFVVDTCNDYPNYDLIQMIKNSKIAVDVNSKDMKVVNVKSKFIEPMTQERLKDLFDPKADIENIKYYSKYVYNPNTMNIFYRDPGQALWNYNTYKPPFWLEDYYYSNGKIAVPKEDRIPSLYHDFLFHLVDQHDISYNYILDWLSNAIHRRNFCILSTIGKQGIGKGVLGKIMELIFGKSNYFESSTFIKSRFNGAIKGKKLVYLDEVTLTTKEEEDRIKALINDTIEVEEKYKSAENIDNYANLYFSSNNIDSIRLTADDRRFSIVNLTETPLISKYNKQQIEDLHKEENIQKLCHYLYYRDIDVNRMSKVLITEHTEKVRSGRLKAWQDYFLDEFCPSNTGKFLSISEAGDGIVDKFGMKSRVGRPGLEGLMDLYPNKFKVVKRKHPETGKQVWGVYIYKEGEYGKKK